MNYRVFNVCLLVGWLLVLVGGMLLNIGWGLVGAGALLLVLTVVATYLAGGFVAPGRRGPNDTGGA